MNLHLLCRLLCVALMPILAGCVSSKYQAASALGAQPQLLGFALGGAPVQTRLETVIIYQGPGSWKKSALWDEFVVTLANGSDEPVTLTAASLVDYSGAGVAAGTDPWPLEKASVAQRDRYLRAGVSFALNTIGYAALTYGAAATGAVVGATVTSTWAGFTAGAVVGVAAVPVAAVLVYANNQKHKHKIETEFKRRRLALPLALAPTETRSGSFFFPMTVSPQALHLEWTMGAKHGNLILPLPMLAGMHLKEPAKGSSRDGPRPAPTQSGDRPTTKPITPP